MQNIVEFHIIGRLGRIDPAKTVTHISVATNYNRRKGETWKSDPRWHRVTLFGKLRNRIGLHGPRSAARNGNQRILLCWPGNT